jgi:hypothetical protein
MQIGVITNPNSRKNKRRPGRASALQSIVGEFGEVRETQSLESIKPVLRDFLRKRARYWVADGGDGALHWMVRMGLEVLQEGRVRQRRLHPARDDADQRRHDRLRGPQRGHQGNAEGLLAALRGRLERGARVEEVEVDSMVIDAVQATADGDVPFTTYGFAVAAGGIGQRFFGKYYEADDPNPKTIVEVVRKTILSLPMAMLPVSKIPGAGRPGPVRARHVRADPGPGRARRHGAARRRVHRHPRRVDVDRPRRRAQVLRQGRRAGPDERAGRHAEPR